MVPKLFGSGKSFKKLAAYLLHDPERAKTDQRVRWTHTLNLAHDHPAAAVDEMLWTYRSADELKRQAGLKAGGRALENPVRHFSLNWHPSENPTREHMIETVESFLAHMKWSDHQALIVCHDDKHPHVHVMVNSVHPETGRALNTSFEKRRAQEWAAAYEKEHELIFCEERLKPVDERTPSPTRETWEKLRGYEQEDSRAERERIVKDLGYFERVDAEGAASREWEALKAHQRKEREQFFIDGKEAYRETRNAAYREVRAEYRSHWREYFDAKRDGADSARLATMKADILTSQNERLDARRSEACAALREQRDEVYAALLARQQEQRHELTERQRDGQRSYDLLDKLYPIGPETGRSEDRTLQNSTRDQLPDAFQRAGAEICDPAGEAATQRKREEPTPESDLPREHHKLRDPIDSVGGLGLGALGAIASIGERLFDGFLGGGEGVAPRRKEATKNPAISERDNAQRAAAAQAEAESRATEEAKLRAFWDERRRRTRERD